jgi:DedD protein
MAETTDINVDELRRRARRRLIGAIVLALAAAVIVPMLLESDPKPLGEDVSVKIPPEDGGKFVNQLSDKGAKPVTVAPAPKSEPAKDPAKDMVKEPAKEPAPANAAPAPAAPPDSPATTNVPATKKSIAQAEQKVLGAPAKPAATFSAPAAAPAPVTAPSVVPPAAGGAATPAPAIAARDASKSAAGESFSVQLAAFADDKGANALANKLKRATYSAYTEPLTTSKGTLWRVRVGPFPSREAAVEIRDKLKSEGYSGIVAVAK